MVRWTTPAEQRLIGCIAGRLVPGDHCRTRCPRAKVTSRPRRCPSLELRPGQDGVAVPGWRCAGAQGLPGRPMAGMSVSPRASQVAGNQKTGGNRIRCNSRPVGLREMWLLGPLLGESAATLAGGFREQHLAQADHLGSDLDILILFDVLECLLERHLAGRLQEDRVIG